jgi:hypothetical protein
MWRIRDTFKGSTFRAKKILVSRIDSVLSILILGIIIVEILSALAPSVEPDALSYHLLRPKYFLERGSDDRGEYDGIEKDDRILLPLLHKNLRIFLRRRLVMKKTKDPEQEQEYSHNNRQKGKIARDADEDVGENIFLLI